MPNGHMNCGPLKEGVGDPQALKSPEACTEGSSSRIPRRLLSLDFETGRLFEEELGFIERLNTLEPFGLNVDTPMGLEVQG